MKESIKYKSLIGKGLVFVTLLTSLQAFSQSLNPLTIGTIKPGDSIVIYYDVTINDPCGCSQITNQGTITGSNFSSLVTNDPKTAAANDPTITLLNMFPLPIRLLEFNGRQLGGLNEISWKVVEQGVLKYEVQRSGTGTDFVAIASIAAAGNNGPASYSKTDINPFNGANYYRLKVTDSNGAVSYSPILKLTNNYPGNHLTVYPNPVDKGILTLHLNNVNKDVFNIEFYNTAGQLVHKHLLNHSGGSLVSILQLPQKIKSGVFAIVVRGKQQVYHHKVIVN